jgi:hypothetical protein
MTVAQTRDLSHGKLEIREVQLRWMIEFSIPKMKR